MIRKIILENYMSHIHTVIEPAAGLTVLIGPNNCGKSAIAHALEMICYNSDAASYAVRHGTKKATVTIETQDEDGTLHTLVWWRKEKTAGYIIDGREISGMGRGNVPDDLHQYLRMPPVESSTGSAFQLHFGLQKKPIFLLDEPPSRAAQFFASSSDADRLIEMQKLHRTKEANAKRDKDKLDGDIAKLDATLAELGPLTELSETLSIVEKTFAQIAAENLQLAQALRLISEFEASKQREQQFADTGAKLSSLQAPPALKEVEPLRRQIDLLVRTQQTVSTNFAKQTSLADLASPPALGDVKTLGQTVQRFGELAGRLQWHRDESTAMQDLPVPPVMAEIATLRQRIESMQVAAAKVSVVDRRRQTLEILKLPCDQVSTKELAGTVDLFERDQQKLLDAQRGLTAAQSQLEKLRKRIQTFVEDHPRCESCGQQITAEVIMTAGGHGHG